MYGIIVQTGRLAPKAHSKIMHGPQHIKCAYPLGTPTKFRFKEKEKGKDEYLYSAILADTILTKRSDMDHSFTCKLHHVCLSLVSIH